MGVHRLTSWSESKPQRERIYEKADLSQFQGKRIIIDAASFCFWVMEDVMGKRDLYYLGDHGPDFIAAVRYFVLTFFHANGIETLWVHDGCYNPAKVQTQQSRRAERISPAVDLNNRLFGYVKAPPSHWTKAAGKGHGNGGGQEEEKKEASGGASLVEIVKEVAKDLREEDTLLNDATGVHQALYLLLDELRDKEGVALTQTRTILEADAYIAAACLEQGYDAVLSSDSDFLVLDCPWIPLRSVRHRSNVAAAPCSFVPRGRFSQVIYELALEQLAPALLVAGVPKAVLADPQKKAALVPIEGFRKLLPDLATTLGNDFFAQVDPLSGQSRGFVKKVTLPICLRPPGGDGDGDGDAKARKSGKVQALATCDLTDKVACARFLLVCLLNGWTDAEGRLDLTSSPPSPLAALLFPNAPRRMGEYLAAREQYDLTSGMARNKPPQILIDAGLVAQYAEFRLRRHQANLVCPTASDEEEEGAGSGGGGGGSDESSGKATSSTARRPRRLRPLASLIALQQYGFPMQNLTLMRRIGYELLLYRTAAAPGLEGLTACLSEPGGNDGGSSPIEIIEETVRLHPNTRSVDLRQPFRLVAVRLLDDDEEKEKAAGGDWRLSQSRRFQHYLSYGPGPHRLPQERRFGLFLEILGYPAEEGREAVAAVALAAVGEGEAHGLEDTIYAFALALRTLLLAYGEDGGVALFEPPQRNHPVYRALLYAAAESLLAVASAAGGAGAGADAAAEPFDPTSRGVRPTYLDWATRQGGGAAQVGARLRGLAFLQAYRACLEHVLDLSDVLGRVLELRAPLALDLSHLAVQRFLTLVDKEEAEAMAPALEAVAAALQVAVLLGIEGEMRVYHPGYRLAT